MDHILDWLLVCLDDSQENETPDKRLKFCENEIRMKHLKSEISGSK